MRQRRLKMSLRKKMKCRTVKARPTRGMSRPCDGIGLRSAFRSDIALRLWVKMPNAWTLAPEFPGRSGFPASAVLA
jgi:hypothetical protein